MFGFRLVYYPFLNDLNDAIFAHILNMKISLQKRAEIISAKINIKAHLVLNTIKLMEEGSTVPFIARYRKEATGSLDDLEISDIKSQFDSINEMIKRKEFILKVITEQGKLTDPLKKNIEDCWDDTALEDIYLPFKKKTKTKATVARERGLEDLSKMIMRQYETQISDKAKAFVRGEVKSVEEALEGARHIIAEWVNENKKLRDIVRRGFEKSAFINSKLIKKKELEAQKFQDYFSFSEALNKIPSHRLLAIFRAEEEKFLKVKIEIEDDNVLYHLKNFLINSDGEGAKQISLSIDDAYKRLLFPSIENEYRKKAKEKADQEAIMVFAENLKQLLLTAPLGSKNILALDPGFRTGCKLVVIDQNGDFVLNDTIYPHPPQMKVDDTINKLKNLVSQHKIDAIAIGNGTAGKESMNLIKTIDFGKKIDLYMVNESGASIYSASKLAREEFPNQDVTVRGAISIGRRLMDPLAELVKIDAKSIGVGQYQHDVNQSKLKEKLDNTVIYCVNTVGVNLNTASKHLLTYVSGLGPGIAQKIVEHRTQNGAFSSLKELLDVPRLGKKAYEQSAGFLRIRNGKEPLDNTSVHPESYKIAKKIIKEQGLDLGNIVEHDLQKINLDGYVTEKIGLPTLKDIITELEKPGLDPRGIAKVFHFKDGINSITDLSEGMVLPGIVNNITKFGAFIDIGIKESGLVHISQIVDRYISDPAQVLSLNQKVMVRVMSFDIDRKRISLSMKDLN